jgi:hypothetical protein
MSSKYHGSTCTLQVNLLIDGFYTDKDGAVLAIHIEGRVLGYAGVYVDQYPILMSFA